MNSLKDIMFTVDFTGSEKVTISDQRDQVGQLPGFAGNAGLVKKNNVNLFPTTNQLHKPSYTGKKDDSMEVEALVKMPSEKFFICVLNLEEGWKLKTKFRFSMKNVGVERYMKEIREYNKDLKSGIEEFQRAHGNHAFAQDTIEVLKATLARKRSQYFDLEFLPCDLSVYNHVMVENPLDIAIHWRRPVDFLQKDDMVSQKKSE